MAPTSERALGWSCLLLCGLVGNKGLALSFVPGSSFISGRRGFVGDVRQSSRHERWTASARSSVSKASLRMAEEGEIEYVKADDGDALQALFAKFCDKDGLMTKEAVKSVPAIAELLNDGDLLSEELDDIWRAAPKFPDLDADRKERVDVDSFIQIYRDIDDIFEEDDDETDESSPASSKPAAESSETEEPTNSGAADAEAAAVDDGGAEGGEEDADDPTIAGDERELEIAFRSICDGAGLVSREAVRRWDEVRDLLAEGMLGEDEFDTLWEQTAKSPGSTDQLDVDGFLSFNVALDDLFVFEDDEEVDEGDSEDAEAAAGTPPTKPRRKDVVIGDDLPPGVIFAELADDDFLVSFDDLKRWGELQDMLDGGDLLPLELQNMYDQVIKAPGTNDKLNEDGFLALYNAIDGLFEDDEGEEGVSEAADPIREQASVKGDLLSLISDLNRDEERLPCGLESTDREQARVLEAVTALEAEPSNIVAQRGGSIDQSDLTGEWELLYSSSSAMKFNKGLSGLGGSFPNGKFGGLKQKLQASKFMSDIEYIEKINIPGSNSFDVTVTGDWKLKSSVNLFTGEPTTVMNVEPERVEYGPTSTRADHWKSLGPLNALGITYLDDDLRIMRGNTSTDTVFVFKRC